MRQELGDLLQHLGLGEVISHDIEVAVSPRMSQASPLFLHTSYHVVTASAAVYYLFASIQIDEHVRARHHLPHVGNPGMLLNTLTHLVAQTAQPLR